MPSTGLWNSTADKAMSYSLRSSAKKTGDDDDDSEPCKYDDKGRPECVVQSEGIEYDPIASNDAENGMIDSRVPTNRDLREGLVGIGKNNEGKCGEFLDKLRSDLGIKKKFEELFDDLNKEYEKTKGKKGGVAYVDELKSKRISLDDEEYPASGEYPYNGKDIYGKERKNAVVLKTRPRHNGAVQTGGYVNNLIHELLHYAGKSLRKFAEAAFAASDKTEAVPTKAKKGLDMDKTYSKYFQGLFDKYCRLSGS